MITRAAPRICGSQTTLTADLALLPFTTSMPA